MRPDCPDDLPPAPPPPPARILITALANFILWGIVASGVMAYLTFVRWIWEVSLR